MSQVLGTIFDLVASHQRMMRWHADAIHRHQADLAHLQVWRTPHFSSAHLHRAPSHVSLFLSFLDNYSYSNRVVPFSCRRTSVVLMLKNALACVHRKQSGKRNSW